MRVLDLFSGIGGFSLGLERTGGFRTVAFCEIDERKQHVLRRHWPETPIFPDVEALRGDHIEGGADVICGGFPCQDVSLAGQRAGLAGKRSGLWREFARLIGELRPRFVIVENVPGLLVRGMDRVLSDLADGGYDAEWDCIPAAAVGAPHLRARVWILAYPSCSGDEADNPVCAGRSELVIRPAWPPEPGAPRVDDGFPGWLVGAAGETVVPQIPEMIGRAILEAERS
ncbi:MAG: DNA cytosine methyltransferase [Methyloceanibacter sp.]